MALFSVRERSELGIGLILAPERFDPRREALTGVSASAALGTLVLTQRKTINQNRDGTDSEKYLVLDTSDASNGIIIAQKRAVMRSEIGSTKKLVPLRSVIISRLRPYLRQVAFVDEGLSGLYGGVALASSTEFFVLTPRDERSIAFLVPVLLSDQVQGVLAASQEGGHHPRFNEEILLSLPVVKPILERRDDISAEVESAIACFRESRGVIERLIESVQTTMKQRDPPGAVPRATAG